MKALTDLCAAERQLENGLTISARVLLHSVYIHVEYKSFDTNSCVITHILNTSVLRYCVQLFLLL